eukprot:COSAG06_NODE_8465_length_2165_cov_1.278316_3_plen_166_part_00
MDSTADGIEIVSFKAKLYGTAQPAGTSWEERSHGRTVYDAHWNARGGKSRGTDKCIVLKEIGDKLQVLYQDLASQTVPRDWVLGFTELDDGLLVKLIDLNAAARHGEPAHLKTSTAFSSPQLAEKVLQFQQQQHQQQQRQQQQQRRWRWQQQLKDQHLQGPHRHW